MIPLYNDRQHFNPGAGGYFSVPLMDFIILVFDTYLLPHKSTDMAHILQQSGYRMWNPFTMQVESPHQYPQRLEDKYVEHQKHDYIENCYSNILRDVLY